MNIFSPVDDSLFFKGRDSGDPRLGNLVKKTPDGPGVAIVGYPDDEGIGKNGGRIGAKEGPNAIRHWLYRMTAHARRPVLPFFDLGNLRFNSDLDHRHKDVAAAVENLLGHGHQVLAFGGGNDYAFADGLGFLNAFKDERPIIVNVDAHLDVRDLRYGLTSGTPFYRLLESDNSFDFVELGVQSHCNAKTHWDYVEKKGGRIITLEEMRLSERSVQDVVRQRLGDWLKPRPAFLAIDIDAFAYPFAAGSSASWPLGLLPNEFFAVLHLFLTSWDVRVLGLYEVAPNLESGDSTAKLAAQWAHMFLHEW